MLTQNHQSAQRVSLSSRATTYAFVRRLSSVAFAAAFVRRLRRGFRPSPSPRLSSVAFAAAFVRRRRRHLAEARSRGPHSPPPTTLYPPPLSGLRGVPESRYCATFTELPRS